MTEKHNVARIGFLINELNTKGHFNRKELSEYLIATTGCDISESSVKRSVNDMREYFGIDIVYSMKNKRYEINRIHKNEKRTEDFLDKYSEVKFGKTDSNDILLFYSFVKSMVKSEYFFPPVNVAGSAGEDNVADYGMILRMLEALMKDEMTERSMELSECIEYHLSEHYKSSQKIKFNGMLCMLLDSMKKKQLVKFTYHETEVFVEPIKIIHYEGKWYFMGFIAESSRKDHLKKVRTYNLSLIKDNIHLTRKKFTGEEFDIPDYKDSFGIIASSNIKTAKIRFYDLLADRMKEMLWFDGQKTTLGEDKARGKYCEYTLPYPSNTSFELISKVLSFGSSAEIIEPEELKSSWKATIRRMHDMIK